MVCAVASQLALATMGLSGLIVISKLIHHKRLISSEWNSDFNFSVAVYIKQLIPMKVFNWNPTTQKETEHEMWLHCNVFCLTDLVLIDSPKNCGMSALNLLFWAYMIYLIDIYNVGCMSEGLLNY